MDAKREKLMLAGICLLIVLLSLGSLGWAAWSGLLKDIDGLLLALVALIGALIFGVQALLLLKQIGLSARSKKNAAGTEEQKS
jgi:hypothetical protein